MFSLLLLWFFSFCGLLCRPPWQRVVGEQSCEEVRGHAGVPPKHQAQRLRQHKQAEHVNGRPVIQLHTILLWGAHHSKKVDERHRRVEGQLHHDAEGFWVGHVLEGCQKQPLNYWIISSVSHTHRLTRFLQPEVWRLIWQGSTLGLLIPHHCSPVKHYPRRRVLWLFSVHGSVSTIRKRQILQLGKHCFCSTDKVSLIKRK